jgi:hypothetical protein
MLLNIATIVPNGLVVFVPSYAFLEQAKMVWNTNGLLEKRLGTRKKLFFEPRDGAEVEALLKDYAESARGVRATYIPPVFKPHVLFVAADKCLRGWPSWSPSRRCCRGKSQ